MVDPQEEEHVNTLVMMMGDLDPQVARRVLRRHKGDPEKAAASILDNDLRGEDATWPAGFGALHETSNPTSGPRTPPPSKPEQNQSVIDLTIDEDKDFKRALEASLETASTTTFGPSNRAPDPNWAVVSSNAEVPAGISQDDQTLNRAIQESLNTTYRDYVEQELVNPPPEESIRKDDRPVALRATNALCTYASLLFQGLFFVPQVRRCLCQWSTITPDPPKGTPEAAIMLLVESFVYMDVCVANNMTADILIDNFSAGTPRDGTESPGEVCFQLFSKLALQIEQIVFSQVASQSHQWPRLFHFRYGPKDSEPNTLPLDNRIDKAVVRVDIRDGEPSHDLISCLSDQLSHTGLGMAQQVIFESSDVVAFQLVRHESLPSYTGNSAPRQRFEYPKHLYLDRFMKENAELAMQKKRQQKDIQEEVQRLTLKKSALTHTNGKDNLKDLYATLYYFENVANKEDPERKLIIERAAMKLRKIVTRIENELETIQTQVSNLQEQAVKLFDDPALQQQRYDLRAVFIHDGIPGRSHLYSYISHGSRWWKTVDYTVTEISEEIVLTDATGLHMGAGPYFLIYNRALSEDEEKATQAWPEGLKDVAKRDSYLLLQQMPPEITKDALAISPPTSPFPSSHVSPSYSPKEDPMDISA